MIRFCLAMIAAAFAAAAVSQDSYPNKPVRVLVSSTAGGPPGPEGRRRETACR